MSRESTPTSSTATSTAGRYNDDWTLVNDPNERRKIQNRIAQRRFREKSRVQKLDRERQDQLERTASAAYTAPDPDDIEDGPEEGLPWGGISLRYIIATGRAKEEASRETSLYATPSKNGGSSRIGLHLIDEYARGSPAWAAWRSRMLTNHASVSSRPSQQPTPDRILST